MATLHKYYAEFNTIIKLNNDKKESLEKSIKSIKDKIVKYFKEEKTNELQPTFNGQGSFYMNTTVNPIPEFDEEKNKNLLKYDLDYGVYFLEKKNEDNKKKIDTWHSWVYNAVDDHTNTPSKSKNTCVRVNFADGHHIDLPIYYEKDNVTKLAHKSKDWIKSKPTEFTDWFNDEVKKNQQLRKIVRFLKAWKNFRETKNTNLKFPSGFALTILATNNYTSDDNHDIAFLETVKKIQSKLNNNFECKRPTTPKNEDIFEDFSKTRKKDFMSALDSLINDLENAQEEKNYKKATECLRKHFGERFPLGRDKDEENTNSRLSSLLTASAVKPKPYAKW
ncbi:cyclic GMP-AMP synthase DncV-like nucleotidyltransferase [Tenacibaculum dicentrarchi]|uniref:cyclic GMP-AMP synthase DncV-like nucleotidyltransferase n=1 Tax=Tenacibaculum dicentrarchi TaxID=669041 RepID=UPI003513431F